ncbi:MAG: hypothetical protein AB7O26_07590 [Planctomycetaceae bacterium]
MAGRLKLAVLLSFAVFCVWNGRDSVDAAEPAGLRAGAFAVDTTPLKFPISINGSMSDILAESAHDPIHARCLVLDDGTTKLAIVVCDSCMIPRELIDAAKALASERTGIPGSNILISATHTHSSPTVTGVFQSDPDEAYRQFLTDRIAEGIEKATANLEPAHIGWSSVDEPGQVFNRRWHLKPGAEVVDPFGGRTDTVQMNPGFGNLNKTKPSGPVDPQVSVLAVRSPDGHPIALFANYSLHYVGGIPGRAVSADYYGEFARRISQKLGVADDPRFVGIMSNGTSGNINNVNFALDAPPRREPFEQIRLVAENIAEAARRAYSEVKWQSSATLAAREVDLDLGVRLPKGDDVETAKQLLAQANDPPYGKLPEIYARETILLAKYPSTVKVKLQAMRVGDFAIAAIPCETFVETGLAIKRESPLKAITISLANGYNGYLPTPEHHQWGGYETWRARSSYLAVDAEPKIRATILKLIRELDQELKAK